MPKKMSVNTKAVEAKARKNEKKQNERDAKQKQIEDEYWKDYDKTTNKKLQRKEEKDEKKLLQLEKKKERENLIDSEMNKMNMKNKITSKITHYELEKMKIKPNQIFNNNNIINKIKENIEDIPQNKFQFDICDARNIDDAINMFKTEDELERHAEKRMKSAFTSFEERRMGELRKERPDMKFSQLKQMIFKEFQKSSENPKNKTHAVYNYKAEDSKF